MSSASQGGTGSRAQTDTGELPANLQHANSAVLELSLAGPLHVNVFRQVKRVEASLSTRQTARLRRWS
eukprot:6193877-Pleurochrysis_carterae.AAC.1